MKTTLRMPTAAILGVACLLVIFIPLAILSSQEYSAYAAAVQAVGVLLAILVALTTLNSDSKDRRVDRTLALHSELTEGSVGDARRRLAFHLRQHGDTDYPVRCVAIHELRDNAMLSKYRNDTGAHDPYTDAELLMRFFERCRLALLRGSVDNPLFAELIGRNSAWWDKAFKDDSTNARTALKELANWASAFARENKTRYSFFANWGAARRYDFPIDPSDPAHKSRPPAAF